MKILQINAVYGSSSTGRTTMELDIELTNQGHESIIAAPKTIKEKDNIYKIGNSFDWKMHGLFSRIFGTQAYFSTTPTKKLVEYIDNEKPDLIHLRNLHGNYINLPILLKYIAKKDIPTVITLHDCWFFTGKCCYYTADGCDKWQTQCDKCPILKKYNKSWFFDRTKKMFNDKKELLGKINNLAVIGVSEWITNEGKKAPIFENAKIIKRIYNWINLEAFCPKDTEVLRTEHKLTNEFVVLCVSQIWSADKGLYKVIELAKKVPDTKILLIGKLPDGCELPENIVSIGVVNSVEKLSAYYSMADVMLNLSVQETFGKTTAEAISTGTPVIGYNATATPELIGNGCGKVLELDATVDKIAEAVEEIKRNGKDKYFNNCVEFAKNNFDKNKLISDYIDLYKEMIEKK